MKLKGSCHCQSVKFSLESHHPYPFNLCYCSICRKTAGGGGYAINLSGDSKTLKIQGKEHIQIYHAKIKNIKTRKIKQSPGERHFCKLCGSALWVYDSRWPKLIHPFASAIDTKLPIPPERTHLMLGSKANWVKVYKDKNDKEFLEYPEESIAEWHKRLKLVKK